MAAIRYSCPPLFQLTLCPLYAPRAGPTDNRTGNVLYDPGLGWLACKWLGYSGLRVDRRTVSSPAPGRGSLCGYLPV